VEPQTTPRRWWRRRLPLLLAAGLVLWLGATAVLLVGARTSALAGLAELEAIRAGATASTLLSGAETAGLRRAEAHFARARSALRSVPVSPLRALPVVGRQLRSADALTGAAGEVADAGGDALDDAVALAEGGAGAGPERARLVAQLAEVAERAERRVVAVDFGPSDALVGPLARARDEAVETVEELEGSLERARVATAGLAGLFQGSSRYLLLVGNNAEMRAGSGMFLTAGPATIEGGRLTVGTLEPTSELLLEEPVEVPPDLADRWGWLAPGREWRNLGVSPRFDVTAPLAARMWEAARGERVEGVLAVDVIALRALLAAVGPIEVEGRTLDATNVEQDLFRDQYAGRIEEVFQPQRSARLATVASATLEALDRPDVDLARLAEELAGAARGRHLLAWSADPPVQRAWQAAGVHGALDADDLLVAVLNRGGNKLDPFLSVDAELVVGDGPEGTPVAVELRLSNDVPGGEAPYILGPDASLDVAPGTYVGLVSASLPGLAREGRFDGVERLAVAGADGPTRVVATQVILAPGQSQVLTLRFQLPAGGGAFDVLSGARAPAVQWGHAGRHWVGDHAERVTW
jgi:hypothetical protein